MSQENIQLIRGLYESFGKGDVPTVLGQMDQNIEWREAENFIFLSAMAFLSIGARRCGLAPECRSGGQPPPLDPCPQGRRQ